MACLKLVMTCLWQLPAASQLSHRLPLDLPSVLCTRICLLSPTAAARFVSVQQNEGRDQVLSMAWAGSQQLTVLTGMMAHPLWITAGTMQMSHQARHSTVTTAQPDTAASACRAREHPRDHP